jgi:hypothetical protein
MRPIAPDEAAMRHAAMEGPIESRFPYANGIKTRFIDCFDAFIS